MSIIIHISNFCCGYGYLISRHGAHPDELLPVQSTDNKNLLELIFKAQGIKKRS